MSKLKTTLDNKQIFFCPGCESEHSIRTVGGSPVWMWNGDVNSPTFIPSILVTERWSEGRTEVCHSFVTDGRIQFLGDCTHQLAGKTVDVPEWPYEIGKYGGIIE